MRLTEPSIPVDAVRLNAIAERLASIARLYLEGRIPPRIERFMLVTPARAYLRTVYGAGNLRVAWRLMRSALMDYPSLIQVRVLWWWRCGRHGYDPTEDWLNKGGDE